MTDDGERWELEHEHKSMYCTLGMRRRRERGRERGMERERERDDRKNRSVYIH